MAIKAAPRVRSDAVPLKTYRSVGRPVAIAGIGAYAPERVVTNQDLERIVSTSDQWITERTGIKRRHIAEAGTTTFELATQAARGALAAAEVRAEDLDLILVATSSPDGPFPSVACRVQEQLGVPGAASMDLLAACTGFVYGLSVAEAYVASGRADTVLVVGAEVLSRYIDWGDRSTCVIFADGAGAAVVKPATRGAGFRAWCLGSDGRGYAQVLCGDPARGGFGAGLSDPKISMVGPDVFKFAVDIFVRQAYAVAEAAGIAIDDIDLFVPHQANRRIIEAAARRIGLPMERVMVNIEEYGNASTATIPLALHDAQAGGRVRAGDTVLMAGFGSGLTWGACLLEWE
ncbi:MAG: ketoacyl-ACP synthase III [Candidatus Dormibacteraeota bacterium]|nr:ketoacyl-ACP synthase III [Candidatus Dormibacteraeota bacterium]